MIEEFKHDVKATTGAQWIYKLFKVSTSTKRLDKERN